jgi:hypothetical protein
MRSPFLRAVMDGSLPLWIWAAQFAFCYGWAALACGAGMTAVWVRAPLVAASLVATVAIVWMLVRACRVSREGLLATVRGISALLALIGVVWAVVPVFVLPACSFS